MANFKNGFWGLLLDMVRNPIHGINLTYHAVRHRIIKHHLTKAVLALPDEVKAQYADEISFLCNTSRIEPFPYPRRPEVAADKSFSSGYDKDVRLPFVVHDGKRLYFPSGESEFGAARAYRCFVEDEGILGNGLRLKSPHSYVTETHHVEPGDIVIDIGCAEALFALHYADVASRLYLYEVLDNWQQPLVCTFKPFQDKTTIFCRLVGDGSGETVKLSDTIEIASDRPCFVKMDIEGYEKEVLCGSKDFFLSHKVKLSCCTYHRQEDAEEISSLLKGWGYKVSFSDGYMICLLNGLHPPYFRKGMIYARNF